MKSMLKNLRNLIERGLKDWIKSIEIVEEKDIIMDLEIEIDKMIDK